LFRYYSLNAEQEKLLAETLTSFAAENASQISSSTDSRAYAGDKGLVGLTLNRNDPIEKKVVAEHSYGHRIRIAKLFESHGQYMDHIIQICGWARRTSSLGKNVFAIHLHDGSTAEEV
jgi:hypothetical protein